MKKLLILLVLSFGYVLSAGVIDHCCHDDELIKVGGFCGNHTTRININCTLGHMLLKDIVITDGTAISTQDSPNFIFVRDTSQYCIGKMSKENSSTTFPVAVVCFQESFPQSHEVETSGVLTLISVVFLAATFAVYLFLPQLRDLHGLCYMNLCISMALGFMALAVLQLGGGNGFQTDTCVTLGFILYFWMMATFFWMNVISINVFRTVLDAKQLKKTQKRQYFLYSCYAWGCSFLFLCVTLITHFAEGDHYKPGFGEGSCWFGGRVETWLFFYGPIAVLISSNIFLFVLSSFSLWRNTRKCSENKLNVLKHRFVLSLRLFLVMGIMWIFEVLSFAHGESHIIWKIADCFNCLQGVVIFVLLVVFRRRAIQGLAKEKCCLFVTQGLANKLSPHDDSCDQEILEEDNAEVRLN